MKRLGRAAVVALGVMAATVPVWRDAQAEPMDSAESCQVPTELLQHDQNLSRLRAGLEAGRPLTVVVLGAGSSLGRGLPSPALAWPARLKDELAKIFPGSRPTVETLAVPGITAPLAVRDILPQALARRPALVVWEVGNADAVKTVPLTDFSDAVTEGIRRLEKAGIDSLLVDMQYSPQTAELFNFKPYREALQQIAGTENVDLFDRWAIMHDYVDTGRFVPAIEAKPQQVTQAVFVHGCLAQLLARMIGDAAAPPAQ